MDPYGDDWSNIHHTSEQLNRWKRVYYAMTVNIDWNVGRILNALDSSGLGDNTIVVLTSDHGEMFEPTAG
jgi:arylsulfatase A-like enzyme